jgi:hypothetical protein
MEVSSPRWWRERRMRQNDESEVRAVAHRALIRTSAGCAPAHSQRPGHRRSARGGRGGVANLRRRHPFRQRRCRARAQARIGLIRTRCCLSFLFSISGSFSIEFISTLTCQFVCHDLPLSHLTCWFPLPKTRRPPTSHHRHQNPFVEWR